MRQRAQGAISWWPACIQIGRSALDMHLDRPGGAKPNRQTPAQALSFNLPLFSYLSILREILRGLGFAYNLCAIEGIVRRGRRDEVKVGVQISYQKV